MTFVHTGVKVQAIYLCMYVLNGIYFLFSTLVVQFPIDAVLNVYFSFSAFAIVAVVEAVAAVADVVAFAFAFDIDIDLVVAAVAAVAALAALAVLAVVDSNGYYSDVQRNL